MNRLSVTRPQAGEEDSIVGLLYAVAAEDFATVAEAMTKMSAPDTVIEPCKGPAAKYHDAKHEVFLRMYEHRLQYNEMMGNTNLHARF